jgi:predicted DNA-binding transcriptional regulator AlpA
MRTTKWVKRAEVARRLGVADVTVDAMSRDGRLPVPKKLGPHAQSPVVYDESELAIAIAKLMQDRL